MSITPLITFKAGICDFDVSNASLFLAFGTEHDIVQEQDGKSFKLIVDHEFRLVHPLPKLFPKLLQATSISTKKMSLSTSAGAHVQHP